MEAISTESTELKIGELGFYAEWPPLIKVLEVRIEWGLNIFWKWRI